MESRMTSNKSETWSSKMPEGLDLEISQHPLKMKSVVNLIIALERLGSSSTEPLSTEFRDENLINMMLENIVEERTVFECHSAPSLNYTRLEEHPFSVTDSEKRNLVVVPNSMELHAVMLQGGAECRKVYLDMSTYVNLEPNTDSETVTLGIRGTNFYLSCYKDGDKPTLHLETVEDKDSLSNITSDSNLVRFLFHKHITGRNVSTLVSVPFSSWYISTAPENNRPVAMCLSSAQRHKTFTIHGYGATSMSHCCL
uniref:Interleukin-1 n=1 Tax=Mola mola TaxID=94237 RepID=A0A3Q3WL90_MOLML